MVGLREKENEGIIEQNEKESEHKTEGNCFETALKGSKIFQKTRKK